MTPASQTTSRLRVLDDPTRSLADACVHCGLCLPTCPTYVLSGHEADSPRGRIELIKAVDDGHQPPDADTTGHLSGCLDCRACETACPSGVQYHRLIEMAKDRWPANGSSEWAGVPGLAGWLVKHVMTSPTRLRVSLLPLRVLQKLGLWWLADKSGLTKLMPADWQRLTRMAGGAGRTSRLWPAVGQQGGTSGKGAWLFVTCVGGVVMPEVDEAAMRVLGRLGIGCTKGGCSGGGAGGGGGCCGAIDLHNGRHEAALTRAKSNIEVWEKSAERGGEAAQVVCTVAGCGAMLRQYAELLAGGEWADRATRFSASVRDISEVVAPRLANDKLNIKPVTDSGAVAYHGACHLAHGQRVATPPVQMLRTCGYTVRVLGNDGVDSGEADLCCGAAGTYNLSHPETAQQLAQRKIGMLRDGDVALAVGNIGCMLHLSAQMGDRGAVRVAHPIELVDEAMNGKA